jgi:hypothetical protein
MTYLEQLYAARSALIQGMIDRTGVVGYSLDGESFSFEPAAGLQIIQDLILAEERRVSGRSDLYIARRRGISWAHYGVR